FAAPGSDWGNGPIGAMPASGLTFVILGPMMPLRPAAGTAGGFPRKLSSPREFMPHACFHLPRLLTTVAMAILLTAAANAEKRVALVIGNSAYKQANKLANPVNDAKEMAAALKAAGFDVILGVDVDKRAFDVKVRNFADLMENADVAIFF